jgi:hypothetical protein
MSTLSDIIEVRHLGGHRLFLRFEDGLTGEVDVSTVVRFEGVFAPLKDAKEFAKVRLYEEGGTICWPSGADIAPEALRDALVSAQSAASAHP